MFLVVSFPIILALFVFHFSLFAGDVFLCIAVIKIIVSIFLCIFVVKPSCCYPKDEVVGTAMGGRLISVSEHNIVKLTLRGFP